jgi:hypothetical protein
VYFAPDFFYLRYFIILTLKNAHRRVGMGISRCGSNLNPAVEYPA